MSRSLPASLLLASGLVMAQFQPIVVPDLSNNMVKAGDNANRAVRVNIVAGAGSGGTAMTDDSAFTPTVTTFTPVGGTYRSVRSSVTDNDAGVFAMTQKRALIATIETPLAASAMDEVNSAVRVNVVAGAGSGGTASTYGAAFPATGTAAGFNDGTNMQGARIFDLDSGGGTIYVLGVNLRRTAAGAATELIGQQTMANSLPVAIASDQSAVAVSGTVTSNQGAAPWTVTGTKTNNAVVPGAANLGTLPAIANAAAPSWTEGNQVGLSVDLGGSLRVSGGGASSSFGAAFPATGSAAGFSDGTNMQGARVVDLDTGAGTFYGLAVNLVKRTSGTPTELIGQAAMAASLPVVIASDQSAVTITGTVTANQGTAGAQANRWPVFLSDGAAAQGTGANPLFVQPSGDGVAQAFRVLDLDTGGGVDFRIATGLAGAASGGPLAVEASTSSPAGTEAGLIVRNIPSGTQTISGTVTANQGTAAAGSGAWPVTVTNTSDTVVKPGDAVNNAIRVNVVAGGASGGTSSTYGAAFPATGTAAGFNDGTNMQAALVFDTNGGGGTEYVLGTNLRISGAAGASIEAKGQQTMANSIPVVVASDQSAITVAQATAANLNATVVGTKTNNNAAPSTNNIGALTALANAAQPTWTEGNEVLLSVDLNGALRVSGASGGGVAQTQVRNAADNAWVNVGIGAESGTALHMPIRIQDTGANPAVVTNTTPGGSDYGLVVRIAGAAAGGTSSNFGSAFPAAGTASGFSDGTNMQGARVFDLDTGGGTIYVLGANLRRSASGAATELIGQQTMANSLPVTMASDQSFAASTPPKLTDPGVVVAVSPNNTGLPVNIPAIVQKTADKSSGSVASLAKAYAGNTLAGNSLIVACAVGNGTAPTITDTQSNTWNQAVFRANSTTFSVGWFYAVNTVGGADTVTCTNNGAAASMAIGIYEVSGLIQLVPDVLDQTSSSPGTGTTLTTNSVVTVGVNELAFAAFAVGTAAQTITVAGGFTNDSGQQDPTTPAGLFSFVSASRFVSSLVSVTGLASIGSSEPWAAALATFKPVLFGVSGQMNVRGDSPVAVNDPGTSPVKVGGVYKLTQDTYTDSTRTQLASTVRGALIVATGVENISTNTAQVAGGTVATVAIGTQKVGIADSIGTAFLSAANGLNSIGDGHQSVQIVGQFDDTGPQTVTENQFGNLRMSSKGVLYGQIRDAAGNERGVNVDATNRLSVSVDNSNVSTNIAQINGVTPLMGNGATGTGSHRVTVANDSTAIAGWGHVATGAAPPTGMTQVGGVTSGATAGLASSFTVCDSFANIQQTAGAQIITGVASRRIYICSLNLVTATAQNIAVVAGTGTVCATNTVAVPGTSGGTTAATGWNFAANSGIVLGGGLGAFAKTTVNADNFCILQSGSGQVSGGLAYAIY